MRKLLLLCVALFLAACGGSNNTEYYDSYEENDQDVYSSGNFHGSWQGNIVTQNMDDIWSLNVDAAESTATFSSNNARVNFAPVDVGISDDVLIIAMNTEEHRIIMTLQEEDGFLNGNFTQYGEEHEISFRRKSYFPLKGVFTVNGRAFVSFEERLRHLRDFPDFADEGEEIAFTYDLNRRILYEDLIERFNLDNVVEGYEDVELMMVLLNWVCDNFLHDGNSGMPSLRNANALVEFLDENPAGGNCRVLAILLAELLRLYGIEAKHITAYAKEEDFFVHVVTHAYSHNLGQWIMLDPTFRLVLTDSDGNFFDLPSLRDAFASRDELFANENAGRNNDLFDMADYKTFMADYLFRFSTATNFGFGAEEANNNFNMLSPLGHQSRGTTTHFANGFWALPQR